MKTYLVWAVYATVNGKHNVRVEEFHYTQTTTAARYASTLSNGYATREKVNRDAEPCRLNVVPVAVAEPEVQKMAKEILAATLTAEQVTALQTRYRNRGWTG